nr:hypothetical protein [Tanacetum cinerariifolium]
TSIQNIAFVSSQNTDSTNEPVSAVASVSGASAKISVSALPNMDTLSDFFRGHEGILEKLDLPQWALICQRWSATTATAIIRAFRKKKNQPTMSSWHSPPQVLLVLTMRKSQFDIISYKTGLESVKARILVYQQNETVFEEDIKLLKLDVQLRDNALMFSSESDIRMPASPKYDRYQSREGYHAVLPPYAGTFMPCKPDLVFHDAPNVNETVHTTFNDELSPTKPDKDLSHTHRPSTPIIEDWVSDSEDDSKADPTQNASSLVQPTKQVKSPRPSVKPVGNPQQALKDEGVIDSRCSRHITGNMSYLSDFKEINSGYVSFDRNLTGGKITGKGKSKTDTECIVLSPKFKLPDENQVLLRVPRENNMYNVNLKKIVPSRDLTYLFA